MEKKFFVIDSQKWRDGGHNRPLKICISFLIIMLLQAIIAIVSDFVIYLYVNDIMMVRPTGILIILMGVYGLVAIIAAIFVNIKVRQQLRCFVQIDNKLYVVHHISKAAFYAYAAGIGAGSILDMKGHKAAGDVAEVAGMAVSVWKLATMVRNVQDPLWLEKTIDEILRGGRGPLDIKEIVNPVIISETTDKIVIKNGKKKLKIYNIYSNELFPLLKGGCANA